MLNFKVHWPSAFQIRKWGAALLWGCDWLKGDNIQASNFGSSRPSVAEWHWRLPGFLHRKREESVLPQLLTLLFSHWQAVPGLRVHTSPLLSTCIWFILHNSVEALSPWNGPLFPNFYWPDLEEHVAGRAYDLHLFSCSRWLTGTAYSSGLRTLRQHLATVGRGGHQSWCGTARAQRVRRPTWHACALPGVAINLPWQWNDTFVKHREHILHFLFFL